MKVPFSRVIFRKFRVGGKIFEGGQKEVKRRSKEGQKRSKRDKGLVLFDLAFWIVVLLEILDFNVCLFQVLL